MIDVNKYENYYFETAKKIFATPSPSGYYEEIEGVLKKFADELGVKFERTNKGCFIFTVQGKEGKNSGALGLSAHADTLGAMIRSFDGDKIKFSRVGGPILSTFDGEYCTVITRDGKKYRGTFEACVKAYIKDRLQGKTQLDLRRVFITHSGVPDEIIETAKAAVLSYQNFEEICVTRAGCTVSSHCGPGTIGVLFLYER